MGNDTVRQELSKLAKSRKDKVTSQVVVEDNNKGTVKLAEFVIEKNYTRYTVAERPLGVVHESVDATPIDVGVDSMIDSFEVGNVSLSDNDVGLETTEFNIWENSDEDVFGFGFSEPFGDENDDSDDPNSELSPNSDNEIIVINDARLDNDNIKVTHFGSYSGNYLISPEIGVLLYDEYTTSIDDFQLSKVQAGNEQVLREIDEQIYLVAAYHAGRDIRRINSDNDIVFIDKTVVRKSEYMNREGDTLTELYDVNNNLLQQIHTTVTGGRNLKITVNYRVKGKLFGNPAGAYRFGVQKYPIDYTEINLEVKSLNSKSAKEKQNFKIRGDRRCLHLPNVQYFKDRMNLDYVDSSNYTVIDDEYELRRICDYLLSEKMKDNVNCFDAETEGLRFHRWLPPNRKHRLVTYSLSWENRQSIIVPVRMRYCKNIRPEVAGEMLRPVLETTKILAHNGAADTRFLIEEGINLNLIEDTMHLIKHIIPFINHIEVVGFGKALDDLVKRAFGVDMIDLMKHVFKPSGVEFDFALLNRSYMIYYGCPDTDWCRQLWKGLRPKLAAEQELSYRYTVEFSKQMAVHGTYSGMGVDEEHIRQERDRAQAVVNILEQVIYAVTGESRKTLSLTSSVQKSTYVFGRMGADKKEARRTKEGRLSADKVVMEKLGRIKADEPQNIFKSDITDETGTVVLTAEELNTSKYPFCKLIRKHGDLDKNITAFYNGILNNSVNGVYYPDYRIGATDTWRTTDRIQITKKNIKNHLGDLQNEQAGYNRWAWSSTDYAAEEFRLAANGSEDWTLIDMLSEYEADPHTMVASELHGIPPYKVTSKLRGETKAANFGIIYGMKPKALATSIYRRDDPDEGQIAIATDLYNLYCYKRALMLQPLEQAKEFVRENGWLENKLGYRMVYHQILDVKHGNIINCEQNIAILSEVW